MGTKPNQLRQLHSDGFRPALLCFISLGLGATLFCGAAFGAIKSGPGPTNTKREFVLDAGQSKLRFWIKQFGVSTLTGQFDRFRIDIDLDRQRPETAAVSATIDVASVDMPNRAYTRLLLSRSWFDAAHFPQAAFQSRKIDRIDQASGIMVGDLTIRGITHPITMTIAFNENDETGADAENALSVLARGEFSRSDYAMKDWNFFVGDRVKIEIEASFTDLSAPAP